MLTQTVKFSAPSLAAVAEHFATKADREAVNANAESIGKTEAKIHTARHECYKEIADVLANLEITPVPGTK